ncbi:hypothetical protein Cadr_000005970 [Camelus dromedarius]|uniref:Uncharacterized protein n=1 Tax=Camelus dromedarius TaxID=9838 RepID=A0A5N4E2M2_CAMDR|nr:hypothetical protein Cadr_000005970 [Camelus dromedarius]
MTNYPIDGFGKRKDTEIGEEILGREEARWRADERIPLIKKQRAAIYGSDLRLAISLIKHLALKSQLGNWQQADVAMTQSKSGLSPVVSSGERSSPQTGDKGESEHTKDQGKPGIKTQENSYKEDGIGLSGKQEQQEEKLGFGNEYGMTLLHRGVRKLIWGIEHQA